MDMLSMLMNARVLDEDGDEIGEVVGFTILGGKMMLSTDIDFDHLYDEEGPDGDGGEEIDENDDEEELDNKKETGNVEPLRAIAATLRREVAKRG